MVGLVRIVRVVITVKICMQCCGVAPGKTHMAYGESFVRGRKDWDLRRGIFEKGFPCVLVYVT